MYFAEYDEQANVPFSAVYYFRGLKGNPEGIETVWYDLLDENYYYDIIYFNDAEITTGDEIDFELCYLLGYGLYLYKHSPLKSVLYDCRSSIRVHPDVFEIGDGSKWVAKKIELQKEFNTIRETISDDIITTCKYVGDFLKQYVYRYSLYNGKYDFEGDLWAEEADGNHCLDYIEEALYDGTFDKLHDRGLMKYHEAGKPKKLAVKWHEGKLEYSAYFWFDYEVITEVFEKFYGAHRDTKTDFIIRMDYQNRKYELALYRFGLKEPKIIPENAYQVLVFKNGFEDYRSENYDQERGAWIW